MSTLYIYIIYELQIKSLQSKIYNIKYFFTICTVICIYSYYFERTIRLSIKQTPGTIYLFYYQFINLPKLII